jgi:hypothetical protein
MQIHSFSFVDDFVFYYYIHARCLNHVSCYLTHVIDVAEDIIARSEFFQDHLSSINLTGLTCFSLILVLFSPLPPDKYNQ